VIRAEPDPQALSTVELRFAADAGDAAEGHARLVGVGLDRGGVVRLGEPRRQMGVAMAEYAM